MEHAVVSCYEAERPDIIFIEGQSSLRNPSGPAGAEWIVSANADAVVLQHHPVRKQYKDMERSEEHTSEPQSPCNLVCRLLLEKKKRRQRTGAGVTRWEGCGRRETSPSRTRRGSRQRARSCRWVP